MDVAELYNTYKSLCFSIAYHLTGSVSEAEDIVQDVYLKLSTVAVADIEDMKAYLCKMTVNRSYDVLKSARAKREQYVGPWLPEPFPTGGKSIEDQVEDSELVGYALLILLERLTVLERTVFVLREALGLEFAVIADIVGKTEVNCRKIMSRSKNKLGVLNEGELLFEPPNSNWIHQFLHALEHGRLDQMVALLREDVTLLSDGGGKVVAALKPIHSRDAVLRFLIGIYQQAAKKGDDIRFEMKELNGGPAVIIRSGDEISTVALVTLKSGAASDFYLIRNPDKLKHLY